LHGPDKAWQIFRGVHWLNDPTAYTTAPAEQWQYRPAVPEPETLSELQQKLVKGAARPLPTLGSLDQSKARKEGRTLHEQARRMLAMNGISGRGGFESESNIWLINGSRARETSGILVNGPQFGWTSPSYVYGVGLHGAGFDVVGSTYLALPSILFGHNGTVGWGSTAGLTDLVDLFEEKLNPIDPDLYFHQGEWKRFSIRTEIIPVKGQAPKEFYRRESVHGPIVAYDPAKGVAYAKSRAWAGYEMQTLGAWFDLARAKNHAAWRQAAERIAVNINFYYLDATGNIAYYLGGRYPVRVADHDPRLPAVGTGEMDWIGIAAPDINAAAYNPKTGFLANWNNKPGAGWPNGDQWWSMWGGAHHVRVLTDKLTATENFTPKEAWDLIRYSAHADHNLAYFLPYLRKALDKGASTSAGQALRILEQWDGQWRDDNADGIFDGPAPAIMEAFLSRLFRAVIADDVGDRNFARFAATSYPVREIPVGADLPPGTRVLIRNLAGLEGSTQLAYDLFNGEDPLAVFRRVFEETVAALGRQFGPELTAWRVAAFKPRYAVANHIGVRFGSETERKITAFQNRGALNSMFWVDNGQLKGVAIATPGQSGFTSIDGRRSRHYEDQQSLYDKYEWMTLPFTKQEVDAHTTSATELRY
ncbi:MAG TPA: penicillin acylase family protein, partial [Pedomonas sp.]|uniref:penicillin acylase family protein n=1 Tax=Pedomonas sp. TaxID=2976421 RepID=UPI002F3F8A96